MYKKDNPVPEMSKSLTLQDMLDIETKGVMVVSRSQPKLCIATKKQLHEFKPKQFRNEQPF